MSGYKNGRKAQHNLFSSTVENIITFLASFTNTLTAYSEISISLSPLLLELTDPIARCSLSGDLVSLSLVHLSHVAKKMLDDDLSADKAQEDTVL